MIKLNPNMSLEFLATIWPLISRRKVTLLTWRIYTAIKKPYDERLIMKKNVFKNVQSEVENPK